MKRVDPKIVAYDAVKWQEFETLISINFSWRSVANPNLDRLMVEVEYLNEVTREVLRIQFNHVVQLQMEDVGPSNDIFPLLIVNVQDEQWDGVYYLVMSEHSELSFRCYSFSFIVIPEREDPAHVRKWFGLRK